MRKMTFIFVVAIVLCGMICSCTNGVSEKETKKSLMIEVPVPETGYSAGWVYRFGDAGTRCSGTILTYSWNKGGCSV